MAGPDLPPGFDFTDPDIYAHRIPSAEFAEVRRAAPIWWNDQPLDEGGFEDGGYWVLSRHKDVREVSRRSDVFSSSLKSVVPRYRQGTAAAQIESGRLSMINMDAPTHTRLRKIIARAFTPRAVEMLSDDLRARAHTIAEKARAEGSGDFVAQVAAELPLQAIAGLLGVPVEDRGKIFTWSNEMVGDEDPEFSRYDATASAAELMVYAMGLAQQRAVAPEDDIITTLINADIDGHTLTSEEFGLFMVTLAVAGNETTRNSITQGMMAFCEFPDQWAHFVEHRPATAVDEIIRWATPVTAFQRTALVDTEIGGVEIAAGQRVVMFYRSANFDQDVFDSPERFDITRDPNPHLAFGGTGAHYCVGANLARRTIGLMFDAIADHLPDLVPTSAPDRLRSPWLNGVKHWNVDYRAGTA